MTKRRKLTIQCPTAIFGEVVTVAESGMKRREEIFMMQEALNERILFCISRVTKAMKRLG
jgi:hypothetical protein